MEQPTLFNAALQTGQANAELCASNAEDRGWDSDSAAEFILDWLRANGPTPGEDLVSEATRRYRPHDARAFGAVFLRLQKQGLIEKCGFGRRRKGHGTHGGVVWRLKRAT